MTPPPPWPERPRSRRFFRLGPDANSPSVLEERENSLVTGRNLLNEPLRHASITTTLNTYGHLFPSLDEELAGRLDDLARDSGVARLWHERDGSVVAMAGRGSETPPDQGVSPWALVVSNHRPPPCKGGALPLS